MCFRNLGCCVVQPRYRELVIGPQVLTLQLVWDQQVSSQEIRETLGHVEEDLDITAMYDDMQVCAGQKGCSCSGCFTNTPLAQKFRQIHSELFFYI